MKRQSETPESGTFTDKMRDQLERGTDAARKMIQRVRELVNVDASGEPSQSDASGTVGAMPTSSDAGPQRGGGEAWEPGWKDAGKAAAKKGRTVPGKAKPSAVVRGAGPGSEATGKSRQPRATITAPRAGSAGDPSESDEDEDTESMAIAPEFATATMGAILLSQGRVAQALTVFERALARHPGDLEAQRGVATCRATLAGEIIDADNAVVEQPEPSEMLDRSPAPFGYNVSEARALPVDPNTIVVFWELAGADVEVTGQSSGFGGTRSLYVVSMRQGVAGVEKIERYIDGIAQTGDYFLWDVPAESTHHVAVGLRVRGEFVPIVHARPVTTPRGRPSAQIARVRGTVAIPRRVEHLPVERTRIVAVTGPKEQIAVLVASGVIPPALVEAAPRPVEEVASAQPAAAFDARPSINHVAEDDYGPMPSSADLALRKKRAGGPGSGEEGDEGRTASGGAGASDRWLTSGQWSSSGQWPSSGQWARGDRSSRE